MIARIAGALLVTAALAAAASQLHRTGSTARAAPSAMPLDVQPAGPDGTLVHGSGYFVVTGTPGATLHLHALIVNLTRQPVLTTVDPVDGRLSRGSITYELPGAQRQGVGAWVQRLIRTIHLAPAGHRLVPFAIHVPRRTVVGTYLGALSISMPQSGTVTRGSAFIHLQMRLAVALVVHVETRHTHS